MISTDDRGSCEWDVHEGAQAARRSVRIRLDNLSPLADEIVAQAQRSKINSEQSNEIECSSTSDGNDTSEPATESSSSWIQWDEEGWHYNGIGFRGSEIQRKERIALYILALDAINFCFWPISDNDNKGGNAIGETSITDNNLLEYEHLSMAMKTMAEMDHSNHDRLEYVFSPKNLSLMTEDKMADLFDSCLDTQKYTIPNIKKRAQLWKEVGECLLEDFNGSALALLDACDKDASRLVELVATSFPGFRDDVHISPSSSAQLQEHQHRVVFLKRAQIFVGDVNAALGLNLDGMDKLTTFADYRVPQILRHWGVLEYSAALASKVDGQIELEKDSSDEVSIRASTVVAVEDLVRLLNERGAIDNSHQSRESKDNDSNKRFTDVTVDWYLWQVGERMHQEGLLKPFHKVRTHFY